MNRAERRKAGKTEKVKTYVLTEDQIQKMKDDAAREATAKAFKMLLSVPVMVLHDKFGFGHIRLDRFMHYALIWFNEVMEGGTPLNEIMKIAEEDGGVRVQDY